MSTYRKYGSEEDFDGEQLVLQYVQAWKYCLELHKLSYCYRIYIYFFNDGKIYQKHLPSCAVIYGMGRLNGPYSPVSSIALILTKYVVDGFKSRNVTLVAST